MREVRYEPRLQQLVRVAVHAFGHVFGPQRATWRTVKHTAAKTDKTLKKLRQVELPIVEYEQLRMGLVNATAGGVSLQPLSAGASAVAAAAGGEEGALLLGGGEGEQDRALDFEIEVGVGDEAHPPCNTKGY